MISYPVFWIASVFIFSVLILMTPKFKMGVSVLMNGPVVTSEHGIEQGVCIFESLTLTRPFKSLQIYQTIIIVIIINER